MSGIEVEVVEGFKALPKRGAEVGGVLLGRRGPRGEFLIDSWQPIPIEHRTGPSYILSDADLSVWADFVRQSRTGAQKFIGIYRSQTRPGLAVTPDDCAIVEKFLPREDGVLLIVKPLSISESVATFYYCDGGAIVDAAGESREFEFGGKGIPAGALSEPPPERLDFIPPVSARWENRPIEQSSPPRRNALVAGLVAWQGLSRQGFSWQRWTSVLLPLSAIAAGVVLGLYAHNSGGSAAENPVPSVMASVSSARGLDLRADRTPEGMRLTWNSNSPVLAGAREGVLTIDDSGSRLQQRLTAEELRAGSFAWRTSSGQTQFEIRVIGGNGHEYEESIHVVRPRE